MTKIFCRISQLILVSIFILYFGTDTAEAVPPFPTVSSGTEAGATIRVFKNEGDKTLMAEAAGLNQTDNRQIKEATLGGYFQGFENIKLGAFFREAYGLRHDDDWRQANGVWQWANSNARGENIFILDATPRFLIQDQLTGEVKIRLSDNFFNSEQTLQIRPGLNYFLLDEGQAFWNFFAQIEFDFPLNYGEKPINEKWLYLGALYHLTANWHLGGFIAEHWQAWTSSSSYLEKGGAPYVISSQDTNLTALIIFEY